METIDWPENATPKEELNDDQIAVIKAAAKYPNINTPTKLTQIAVGDKRAYSYSSSVISTHWPERYWVNDSNDDDENDSGNSGLSDSRVKSTPEKVKTVRKRALSGESASKISEDYDASKWTVQGWIKGDHGSTVKSPPPLEYSKKKNQYVALEERESQTEKDALEQSKPRTQTLTETDVKQAREMALGGNDRAQIAEFMDENISTVGDALRGTTWEHIKSPPPLEYDSHKGRYVPKEGYDVNTEPSNSDIESEPKDDLDRSPTPTDTGLDKRKALGVVAVAYVIYRLIRRLL